MKHMPARVESGALLVEASLIDEGLPIEIHGYSCQTASNAFSPGGRPGDRTTGKLDCIVPPAVTPNQQPHYWPYSTYTYDRDGYSGAYFAHGPPASSNLNAARELPSPIPSYPYTAHPHQQPHSMPPPQHQYAYYHGEYSPHPPRHDSFPPAMVRDDGLPVRSLPMGSVTPTKGPITPTWDELHHLFQPLIQKTIQEHMAELKHNFQEQAMELVTSVQERFLEEQKKQHEEFLKHLEEREARTQHSLRQVLQRQSAHELSLKTFGQQAMTTLTEMQNRIVEQQEQQHENLQQQLYFKFQRHAQCIKQQRPNSFNENQVHNKNGHTTEKVERSNSEPPPSLLPFQPPQQFRNVSYEENTGNNDLTIPVPHVVVAKGSQSASQLKPSFQTPLQSPPPRFVRMMPDPSLWMSEVTIPDCIAGTETQQQSS